MTTRTWTYPLWAPLLGVCLFGICVVGIVQGERRILASLTAVTVGLLLVDVTWRRLVLDERGITLLSPWRGPRSIAFEQMVEVHDGLTLNIIGRDGAILRIPDHLGRRKVITAELARACADRGIVVAGLERPTARR